MSTFAITDQSEVIEAVNYAISNLGASTGVLANNALTVNTTTNAVTVGVALIVTGSAVDVDTAMVVPVKFLIIG